MPLRTKGTNANTNYTPQSCKYVYKNIKIGDYIKVH